MEKLIAVEQVSGFPSDNGFIRNELPVLFKGACLDWDAYQKWSVDFFKEKYGEVEVPMSNYRKDPYQRAQTKSNMKIAEYLESALRISSGESGENEDLYSAGWFFCRGYCELLKDLKVPACFKENWADRVQKVIHFDARSILFGHPKVESPLHTDSFFVSTYFAMIRGQKRMRLVAPEHSAHVFNGCNVFDPEVVNGLAAKGVPVYETVISEGDVVWFPPGWWHHVKNDTFTISITTNYVDAYHFLPFEQQVRATLIKPLLNLGKVKAEVVGRSATYQDLSSLNHSQKVVEDAFFLRNEKAYVDHFRNELESAENLIAHFSVDRSEGELRQCAAS